MTNREIAARQSVSLDAVKYHVSNALLKLGLPSKAALMKWDGVAKASARKAGGKAGGKQVETQQEVVAIGQISRKVSDISAACSWFETMLGLKPLYTYGDMAFFDCGGLRLYLQQAAEGLEGESILYFTVGDIEATYQAMTGKGVTFHGAPHKVHTHADGTEEWMAFFDDPDGRPLAIMARYGPNNSSE